MHAGLKSPWSWRKTTARRLQQHSNQSHCVFFVEDAWRQIPFRNPITYLSAGRGIVIHHAAIDKAIYST